MGILLQRGMESAQEWGRVDKAFRVDESHTTSSNFFKQKEGRAQP